MPRVADGPVIALVDGEHHPAAVRAALDRLDAERGVAGVVFLGGEEKLGPGAARRAVRAAGGGRGTTGCASWRRRAAAVVDLADEPVLPAGRAAAARRAGAPPGPGLRGAGRAAGATRLRAGALRRAQAGGDRHRQAHRQDGRGRSLGRASARPRRRARDRLHGPWRPRRAAGGRARHGARRAARDRRTGAGTPPPTTSRTPSWRACARSAAGAWAAAWPGRRPSRTCPPARPWPPLWRPARSSSRARGPASRPWRWTAPSACWAPGRPSRSPTTGCCAPTWCWPRRERGCRRPARSRSRCAPEPAEPVPDRRPRGAVHHRAGPPRRGSSRSWSRPTWPADARWPPISTAPPRERCDVYLTELKAAAVDTVAVRARAEGARVIFLRNRPVGVDEALVKLYADVA